MTGFDNIVEQVEKMSEAEEAYSEEEGVIEDIVDEIPEDVEGVEG